MRGSATISGLQEHLPPGPCSWSAAPSEPSTALKRRACFAPSTPLPELPPTPLTSHVGPGVPRRPSFTRRAQVWLEPWSGWPPHPQLECEPPGISRSWTWEDGAAPEKPFRTWEERSGLRPVTQGTHSPSRAPGSTQATWLQSWPRACPPSWGVTVDNRNAAKPQARFCFSSRGCCSSGAWTALSYTGPLWVYREALPGAAIIGNQLRRNPSLGLGRGSRSVNLGNPLS